MTSWLTITVDTDGAGIKDCLQLLHNGSIKRFGIASGREELNNKIAYTTVRQITLNNKNEIINNYDSELDLLTSFISMDLELTDFTFLNVTLDVNNNMYFTVVAPEHFEQMYYNEPNDNGLLMTADEIVKYQNKHGVDSNDYRILRINGKLV